MQYRHESNNFDFIRLLAAAMVLCSHQYAVMDQPEPMPFGLFKLGTLGVLIFFATSGYLVVQSWERDPHAWRFAVRRFLRIWPGLAVVTAIATLCVGPIFSHDSFSSYFRSGTTWAYFSQLYLRIKLDLPGVFQANPLHVVNGSLWTIPVEVEWYGVLLVAGICGLLNPRLRYILLVLVLLYAGYIYFVFDVQHNPLSQFLSPKFGCEYGSFFCYGALLHCMRREWRANLPLMAGVLLILAGLFVAMKHAYAAVYVWLPFLVVWFGEYSTPMVRNAGRFGDFSYGIYIYAFLVQQMVVSVMGIHHSYLTTLLVTVVCTLFCAVLSWHLVEGPALRLKRYFDNRVAAAERAGQSAKQRATA
ncbi:acyltransferase family protein [Dyella psychrodurans]|uniref:Acyltransferase n=1 Tax=Dyella psychrodurans TaxID=1927960 RepID=A0A370XBB9_9GAMM|nr:acyltransferase [Dyella psychrodurans]RDS85602.1 acyltransferase [Dyella psychrodurans]